MEENKNNAIEKVEKIINGSKVKSPTEEAEKRAERVGEKQKKTMIAGEKRMDKLRRRADIREKKAMQRAEKKRYAAKIKAEKMAKRAEEREYRVSSGRENEKWKIGTVSLGITTLILASILMMNYIIPSSSETGLESAYRKAFYDTVEQVDNIDANLSKALVTKDDGALQIYLVDTAVSSELCENDIQELPLKDENKFYTAKLVNQIGDFCKHLNKKVIRGEKITEEEWNSLRSLYSANKEFKNSLQQIMGNMDSDFSFTQIADGGAGNVVVENFDTLQNLSQSYPELIYDGPFSDGKAGREIKGISGENINKAEAIKIFEKIFSDRGVKNVTCSGLSEAQTPMYNVSGEVDGENIYAEITQKGGKLLMFSFAGNCNKVEISEEQAISNAQKFLEKSGFENMSAVWINLANNLYTINFAAEQGGVVIYSDLVKVRVCGETGTVIGLEATTYYTNHKERTIGLPTISVGLAREKVSDDIEVMTERLCVVPTGRTSEKLCYEFMGTADGSTYYVYIDAKTGRQTEMFKVIESTEGKLLV